MPPSSRNTTAQTAASLMKRCAVRHTLRPVVSQRRTPPAASRGMCSSSMSEEVSALMGTVFESWILRLFHEDLPDPPVVADAAELVAHDRKLPGLRRRDR